jgi:hypothetical protein
VQSALEEVVRELQENQAPGTHLSLAVQAASAQPVRAVQQVQAAWVVQATAH